MDLQLRHCGFDFWSGHYCGQVNQHQGQLSLPSLWGR